MRAFWLSFASKTTFLGACLAEGQTLEEAIRLAWVKKCNPGGQVAAWEVTGLSNPGFKLWTIYSKPEIDQIDHAVHITKAIGPEPMVVHEKCNEEGGQRGR